MEPVQRQATGRIPVVADVNILFSGFVGSGDSPPRQIIDLWIGGVIELIVSPKLLDEARSVFGRPSLERWVQGRGDGWVEGLRRRATIMVDPDDQEWTVPSDPDDAYLVALAVAADAILVSGDGDLTVVIPRPPIRICSARAFLEELDLLLRRADEG